MASRKFQKISSRWNKPTFSSPPPFFLSPPPGRPTSQVRFPLQAMRLWRKLHALDICHHDQISVEVLHMLDDNFLTSPPSSLHQDTCNPKRPHRLCWAREHILAGSISPPPCYFACLWLKRKTKTKSQVFGFLVLGGAIAALLLISPPPEAKLFQLSGLLPPLFPPSIFLV